MQANPTDFYLLLPIMVFGAFLVGVIIGNYMERRRNVKKQNLYERAAMQALLRNRKKTPM